MKFIEKDLEQIIFESGRDSLDERGLVINGILKRQVRIGNYGIADLVEIQRPCYDGYNNEFFQPGRIIIYELKKEQIGISAFLQSLKYAKGISEYLKKRQKSKLFTIDIVLIGKRIDTSGSFCMIPNILSVKNEYGYDSQIYFYTYEYSVDGLWFEEHNFYDLSNKGF